VVLSSQWTTERAQRAFNVLPVEHFKDFDKEFWHSALFS
jgi:hypothetical protein